MDEIKMQISAVMCQLNNGNTVEAAFELGRLDEMLNNEETRKVEAPAVRAGEVRIEPVNNIWGDNPEDIIFLRATKEKLSRTVMFNDNEVKFFREVPNE